MLVLHVFLIEEKVYQDQVDCRLNLSIPLLVHGHSLMAILNPRVSACTFHSMPNPCSSGSLQPRSLSLTSFFLKVAGIECNTSLVLVMNFVKLNPRSLHIDLKFLISLITSSSQLIDFNKLSTWQFSLSLCVALVPYLVSFSFEVLFSEYLVKVPKETPPKSWAHTSRPVSSF